MLGYLKWSLWEAGKLVLILCSHVECMHIRSTLKNLQKRVKITSVNAVNSLKARHPLALLELFTLERCLP